jgi:hypothetical protein
MLYSTFCTTLWYEPINAYLRGKQGMVDGGHGKLNQYRVNFTNQISIYHFHLTCAMEACQVNKINIFGHYKLTFALLHPSSRQQLNIMGNLYLTSQTFVGHENLILPN